MTFETNPSGYVRFPSEEDLYAYLEETFLSRFTNVKCKHEYSPGCIIDFWAEDMKNRVPVLIEVKNWFIKIRDVEQIVKYLAHASGCYGGFPAKNTTYRFILICGGVHEYLGEILEWLGVEIVLTRQLVGEE